MGAGRLVGKSKRLIFWLGTSGFGVIVFVAALLGSSGVHLYKLLFLGPTLLLGWLVFIGRVLLLRYVAMRQVLILLSSTPLVFLYYIGLIREPNEQAIVNVGQLLLALGFFVGVSSIYWRIETIATLGRISTAILAAFTLQWVVQGMPPMFAGILGHPNSMAQFAYLVSFFPLSMWFISRRRSDHAVGMLGAFLVIVLLIASDSRASILAMFFTIITYISLLYFARMRRMFKILYFLIVAGVLLTTLIYTYAPEYDWAWAVNSASIKYTGKSLFSGRDRFWPVLIQAIQERPWLGYGPGVRASTFSGMDFSSHNLYIQIALQSGLLGLISLIAFLWTVWANLSKGLSDKCVQLSVAYFVGVLFHQVFEVSLIQTNLSTGFLAWLVLGVGVSRTLWGEVK